MDITEIVAHNLKTIRLHYNHSQQDLAELLGIDKGRVSKYENMKVEVKVSTLFCIGKVYEINPLYMMIDSRENFTIWLTLAKDSQNHYYSIMNVLDYLENY
ncbi:helix-turn-helix domain-containing protein [Halobacillus litoralis]|uniref:helix-turn-helix domain-containing protein n=1 Tax=Halobacillus litoralis TaxID=45668 RepID=UPI001CD4CF61|nr:helix-turn-helix transcriptional regulator [Halobacillus litoralis]MCA1021592.1 helix-turn-helix domain-containing protein [Halobacillus litoralis]